MKLAVPMPHLEAAMTYSGTNPEKATCFQRSAALMLDLKGATLVFGVMRAARADELLKMPNASTVPFIHAWVEVDDKVFAPTTIEKVGSLMPFPRDVYYRENGIRRTWRLEQPAFQKVAKRFKLSSAFRHRSARAGDGRVTDALLAAAGVKYVLSEHRSVLPHPSLLENPS